MTSLPSLTLALCQTLLSDSKRGLRICCLTRTWEVSVRVTSLGCVLAVICTLVLWADISTMHSFSLFPCGYCSIYASFQDSTWNPRSNPATQYNRVVDWVADIENLGGDICANSWILDSVSGIQHPLLTSVCIAYMWCTSRQASTHAHK